MANLKVEALGHKSSRITTHYSGAELSNLIAAANKVCATDNSHMPVLIMLKNAHPHKIPTRDFEGIEKSSLSP